MTREEFLKQVSYARRVMLIPVGEALAYKSWSNDFRQENLIRAKDLVKKDIGLVMPIGDNELTKAELEDLGFGLWDEERDSDNRTLWLIPIWLAPFLVYGQNVKSITGDDREYNEKTDLDHRGGCLAFGFMLKA